MQCIVFPYACREVLIKNQLNDSSEQGPQFVNSGMLRDADLGVIMQHGSPFVCMDIIRVNKVAALYMADP